ncbi:MAG: uroporphyrinogen decarboxylase family protein [Candidatus Thiodiazotropha sp. (ex Dulcina madagascariensis)]|nr:uroporphyrinogen decarboxylase family protein [Candidatus Thiodiazotropha sp. (ex Dulcina madagascariensis)]MCU7926121.1 uroporphyrinogen decarboxylase family protein [Candidatus Thiodiazotropha sp. (ex Dulcina madagascariensis)]
MNGGEFTSLQRVLTTLDHREPDRVPFFLLLTITGAKFAECSIETYFSDASQVAEMQLRMHERYRHDCLYGFYYASAEVEPFGGSTHFFPDGPPNAGPPPIHSPQHIDALATPDPESSPVLRRVLDTQRLLKSEVGDRIPIIGVVMSPFSIPVMQMGFERYLNLMFEEPERFWKLMAVNEAFCVNWANAQLQAGATAICYFDPVSSTTVITRDHYLKTGLKVAKQTLSRINGPTATHLASGNCLPILEDIATTGTAIVGVSVLEDLRELKQRAKGKISLLGNLNGIEMARWTAAQAEAAVKKAIAGAGPGGGFIVADNHGEIPWQVSDEVLIAISEAVHRWGEYPLAWAERYED